MNHTNTLPKGKLCANHLKFFGVATILLTSLTPSFAYAAPAKWHLESTATAPTPQKNITGTFRSADGTTWAPGGAGATNTLTVNGKSNHVDSAGVAYNTVSTSPSNACVDKFEIAYYQNGIRKTKEAGPNCAPIRTSHRFELNEDIDNQSSFCGRVLVGGVWGNYACVQIKK
jgi:hypothetical protein